MASATRFVIIMVTCTSLSRAINLFDISHAENIVNDLAGSISDAVDHYVVRDVNSEEAIHKFGTIVDWTSSNHQNNVSVSEGSELNNKSSTNLTVHRNKREVTETPSSYKIVHDGDKNIAVKSEEEGRKLKLKRMVIKMALALKMLTLGFILPGAVVLSMVQSWKAVTISLLAFGLAAVLGIKNLVKAASNGSGQQPATPHIVHATWPSSSSNVWRALKVKPEAPIIVAHDDDDHSSHELAYRKHFSP